MDYKTLIGNISKVGSEDKNLCADFLILAVDYYCSSARHYEHNLWGHIGGADLERSNDNSFSNLVAMVEYVLNPAFSRHEPPIELLPVSRGELHECIGNIINELYNRRATH